MFDLSQNAIDLAVAVYIAFTALGLQKWMIQMAQRTLQVRAMIAAQAAGTKKGER